MDPVVHQALSGPLILFLLLDSAIVVRLKNAGTASTPAACLTSSTTTVIIHLVLVAIAVAPVLSAGLYASALILAILLCLLTIGPKVLTIIDAPCI